MGSMPARTSLRACAAFSRARLVVASSRPRVSGGGSGSRTHDTVARTHAFQACAFSHSAIPPAQESARNIVVEGAEATRAAWRLKSVDQGHVAGLGQVVAAELAGPLAERRGAHELE